MKIGWKRPAVALGAAAVCILLAGMLLVILHEKGKTEMETGIYFKKETGNAFFTNDLGITDIGDPFVLKTETDGYYMYCTSAPNGFYCWKSEDLVNWSGKEMCYVRQPDSWCVDCFWAPEVVFYEGKYYMFYTAKNQQDSLRIGLAVSEKPGGPFLDVKNEPLFDFGYAAIDANVLIDADGKKYLYYSRDCSENVVDGLKKSEIYGVPLSDDLLSVQGEAVKLLTPQQKWEKESGDTQWNEGPEMITHEGKYYLTYSANFFASRHIHWGMRCLTASRAVCQGRGKPPAYIRNKKRRVGHRTSQLHTVAGRHPAVGGLSFPYESAGAQRKPKGEYRSGRLHSRRKALYQRAGDRHAACTFRNGGRGYHQSFHRNGGWKKSGSSC